jgi:hypothetical protein
MNRKITASQLYWGLVALLFLTLPLSLLFGWIGMLLGCENPFAGRCYGSGSVFSDLGALLAFVCIFAYPLGFTLAVVGAIAQAFKRTK